MSHKASIEALENYRTALGEDRIGFFTGLWETSDQVEDESMDSRFLAIIAYLDGYRNGLRDAVSAFDKSALALDDATRIHVDDVDASVAKILESCAIDPQDELAPFIELAVVTAMQPRVMTLAASQGAEKQTIRDGHCPVCGADAALGMHRDDGQAHGASRDLWCSLCETVWGFPRIKCARCGCEHQEQLGFKFAEGDRGHRIYTCNECGGTLKVVSEADGGANYDPRVEELVMEDLLDAVLSVPSA